MLRIRRVAIRNLLSFGAGGEWIGLEKRNVLIGGQGSGKGNFLRALGILGALPHGLDRHLAENGGAAAHIRRRKGDTAGCGRTRTAEIRVEAENGETGDFLEYRLGFRAKDDKAVVTNEEIRWEGEAPSWKLETDPETGETQTSYGEGQRERQGEPAGRKPGASVLEAETDPAKFPGIARARAFFAGIRTYRAWAFSPARAAGRVLDDAKGGGGFPVDDGSNLAAVLRSVLKDYDQEQKVRMLGWLGCTGMRLEVPWQRGGSVRIRLRSDDDTGFEAPLSAGMLRHLGVLAAAEAPCRPGLVCLDLPETGLHPDVVTAVADMLKQSENVTQFVVRTHSEGLVSAHSRNPETILVADAGPEGTELKRIPRWVTRAHRREKGDEEPCLADLWASGEIGGVH